MKVYVFGNKELIKDSTALEIADKLHKDFPDIQFEEVKLNENLPFADGENAVILDTVAGLSKEKVLGLKDLDNLVMPPRSSVHDFDLGFQLKYLQKLGKLGAVKIVGLPQIGSISYDSIHSIFKKLVAQDIQGS
jgi:hypothetical protein